MSYKFCNLHDILVTQILTMFPNFYIAEEWQVEEHTFTKECIENFLSNFATLLIKFHADMKQHL